MVVEVAIHAVFLYCIGVAVLAYYYGSASQAYREGVVARFGEDYATEAAIKKVTYKSFKIYIILYVIWGFIYYMF